MALSVTGAIKTAFGSLKSDVGQKLVGLFFLIQAVNFGSGLLIESASMGLQAAGALVMIAAGIASIAATIGALRSFREEALERSFFTSNLLKPFARTLGANITTVVFAYLIAIVLALPAYLVALGGISASSVAAGSVSTLSGIGAAGIVLAAIGVILGIAGFAYVTISLILSQPLIAIEDKRMFQALDESIQRTKGSRLGILLSIVAVFVVYLVAVILGGLLSVFNETVGTAAIQMIAVPIFTPVFLSLLNHFSEELQMQ